MDSKKYFFCIVFIVTALIHSHVQGSVHSQEHGSIECDFTFEKYVHTECICSGTVFSIPNSVQYPCYYNFLPDDPWKHATGCTIVGMFGAEFYQDAKLKRFFLLLKEKAEEAAYSASPPPELLAKGPSDFIERYESYYEKLIRNGSSDEVNNISRRCIETYIKK